ncbi:hypothetical protein [Companilactobacillus furfuricola]|uniref:hypothetical protein n=1 Tax=Companilactobacillus furfuricola TaxID=1462575 RepID=UPI000F79B6ED|nr:hypothetical protein [Companilactobacillus furfuricola]
MRQNIKKYLLIIVLAFVACFSLPGTNQNSISSQNVEAAEASPVHPPSGDPIGIIGAYIVGGYTLQPTSQYTYLDRPVTLQSKAVSTLLDVYPLRSFTYQWMMSKDGVNWGDPDDLDSANITLPADSVGTRYYQSTYTRAAGILGNDRYGYYSKMVSVTVLPEPVEAKNVNVTTDDDYLYNNQENASTTYAHAQLEPFDSTATVTWSLGGSSSDLATIDPNTGLITANNNGKSGTIEVIATAQNSDDTTVTVSTNVTIGGGLDNQKVDEGKTATFDIGGKFATEPDSIVWHKIVNNQDTVISGADKMSYTTPATIYDDNGAQYYAVIKITHNDSEGNPQTSTITTNKATLTVIPDKVPRVLLNNMVINNTYDDHNADNSEINNVISGDNITIKGTATDDNKNSAMSAASIKIKLPKDIEKDDNGQPAINDVKLDGQTTDNYYVVSNSSDPGTYIINFYEIDFTQTKSHSYEFNFNTVNKNTYDFVTVPALTSVDANEDPIDGTYEGNSLTIHFTDGKLAANANNLDYGTLKYGNIGKPQTGTVEGDDSANVLTVNDNRRDKTSASIYVAQSTPFTTSNGEKILPAELRFYNVDGSYKLIGNDNTLVSSSSQGQPLTSVKNGDDYGIKLYIQKGASQYGQFNSTIEWTFQNAPN